MKKKERDNVSEKKCKGERFLKLLRLKKNIIGKEIGQEKGRR
jgi:hypothetical protein